MKYDVEIDFSYGSSHSLILQRIKPNSKVLEFGPATGYMTKYMKEQLNCFIYCVEVDSEAANIAKAYSDKMVVTDLDNMTWVKEMDSVKFDYILFADVLEHLRDPWKVLSEAVKFLNEDGFVLTSIPNISHNAIIMNLLEGKFNYNKIGLLDDTHIRFFTRNSVVDLLKSANLMPVEWLSTMMKPENTEFHQKYENFPDNFKEYLLDREDGHVYQFVTVSKKGKIDDALNSKLVNLKNNYLDDYYIQVYWNENGDFSEKKSIREKLLLNNEFKTYSFDFPYVKEGFFRIDPLNMPGYAEIKNIVIYKKIDDSKEIIFDCSAKNNFDGLQLKNGTTSINSSVTFNLVSINDDPQIYIDLGVVVTGNLVLEVEIRVIEGVKTVFDKLVQKNTESKELLDSNISIIELQESQLNNFYEKNVHLESKINELQSEYYIKIEELKNYENIKSELSALVTELEELINKQKTDIQSKDSEISNLKVEVENLSNQNEIILSSRSWRYTSFFRGIAKYFNK